MTIRSQRCLPEKMRRFLVCSLSLLALSFATLAGFPTDAHSAEIRVIEGHNGFRVPEWLTEVIAAPVNELMADKAESPIIYFNAHFSALSENELANSVDIDCFNSPADEVRRTSFRADIFGPDEQLKCIVVTHPLGMTVQKYGLFYSTNTELALVLEDYPGRLSNFNNKDLQKQFPLVETFHSKMRTLANSGNILSIIEVVYGCVQNTNAKFIYLSIEEAVGQRLSPTPTSARDEFMNFRCRDDWSTPYFWNKFDESVK